PFSGKPSFPADLSLQWSQIALVAGGVPAAAALAPGLALRRVRMSPLGVSRRVTPAAPRASPDLPPLARLAPFAWFVPVAPAGSAFGVIASIVAQPNASTGGELGRDIVAEYFMAGYTEGQPQAAPPDAVLARLQALPGVRGVTVIQAEPFAGPTTEGPQSNYVSCAELATVPALGRCATGAGVVKIPPLPPDGIFTRQ